MSTAAIAEPSSDHGDGDRSANHERLNVTNQRTPQRTCSIKPLSWKIVFLNVVGVLILWVGGPFSSFDGVNKTPAE